MRDFFKSELETLHIKTGLLQYFKLSEMPDAAKQFKILFDSLELVCKEFDYIPEDAKKRIIQDGMIRDSDFQGFNSRIVWKWLNGQKDKFYKGQSQYQEIQEGTPFNELPAHIQKEVNDFKNSLLGKFNGVPEVSKDEMEAIKKEDERRANKPMSMIASNPRPKFKVNGYEVYAVDEAEARKAFLSTFNREIVSVEVVEEQSEGKADNKTS